MTNAIEINVATRNIADSLNAAGKPLTPNEIAAAAAKAAREAAVAKQALAFTNSLVSELDQLAQACADWEAGAFATANEGLYNLLASCLSIYNTRFITGSDDDRKALRTELVSRLRASGINAKKSTMTMTLLIRFIFKADSRRAHAYSYVMRAALEAGVAAAQLPDFIREAGGVEEIRRKAVVSEEAAQRRAAVAAARNDVEQAFELASVNPLAVIDAPQGVALGNYCLVVGIPRPDNTIALVNVLGAAPDHLVDRIKTILAKQSIGRAAEAELAQMEVLNMIAPTQYSAMLKAA
jgi:hypothetical protein